MDRPSLHIAALAIVGLLGVGSAVFWYTSPPVFPYGRPEGLKIQFVPEISSGADRQVFELRGEASRGQAILTKSPSKKEALQLIDAEMVGVRSTYEKTTAPYPGQITKTIECDTKRFVRERDLPAGELTGSVVVAAANDRRVFGICALDEVKYVGGVWAAYDEARRSLVLVKIYASVNRPAEIETVQKKLWETFLEIAGQTPEA